MQTIFTKAKQTTNEVCSLDEVTVAVQQTKVEIKSTNTIH